MSDFCRCQKDGYYVSVRRMVIMLVSEGWLLCQKDGYYVSVRRMVIILVSAHSVQHDGYIKARAQGKITFKRLRKNVVPRERSVSDVTMIHKHYICSLTHAGSALCPLPRSPLGTGGQKVAGKLQHVSVSPQGHVWGVNSANNIYIRTGITTSNKGGSSWKEVPGSLKQISAGGWGVWGVNARNEV